MGRVPIWGLAVSCNRNKQEMRKTDEWGSIRGNKVLNLLSKFSWPSCVLPWHWLGECIPGDLVAIHADKILDAGQ
jgi:hypothetical protein